MQTSISGIQRRRLLRIRRGSTGRIKERLLFGFPKHGVRTRRSVLSIQDSATQYESHTDNTPNISDLHTVSNLNNFDIVNDTNITVSPLTNELTIDTNISKSNNLSFSLPNTAQEATYNHVADSSQYISIDQYNHVVDYSQINRHNNTTLNTAPITLTSVAQKLTHGITNLTVNNIPSYEPSDDELRILALGLNFIPEPSDISMTEIWEAYDEFASTIRWKEHMDTIGDPFYNYDLLSNKPIDLLRRKLRHKLKKKRPIITQAKFTSIHKDADTEEYLLNIQSHLKNYIILGVLKLPVHFQKMKASN